MNNILATSSWWPLNKHLTLKLGIEASLILSDLSTKQQYFSDNKKLDNEGYFYNEQKNIEKDTGISVKRQAKALKILKQYKLISIVKKGVPGRNYYKIRELNIRKFLLNIEKENGRKHNPDEDLDE